MLAIVAIVLPASGAVKSALMRRSSLGSNGIATSELPSGSIGIVAVRAAGKLASVPSPSSGGSAVETRSIAAGLRMPPRLVSVMAIDPTVAAV